jgi:hypothetical protein
MDEENEYEGEEQVNIQAKVKKCPRCRSIMSITGMRKINFYQVEVFYQCFECSKDGNVKLKVMHIVG